MIIVLACRGTENWPVVLFLAIADLIPAKYFAQRAARKDANISYLIFTKAGTDGWVGNDFVPAILVALSVLWSLAFALGGVSR